MLILRLEHRNFEGNLDPFDRLDYIMTPMTTNIEVNAMETPWIMCMLLAPLVVLLLDEVVKGDVVPVVCESEAAVCAVLLSVLVAAPVSVAEVIVTAGAAAEPDEEPPEDDPPPAAEEEEEELLPEVPLLVLPPLTNLPLP